MYVLRYHSLSFPLTTHCSSYNLSSLPDPGAESHSHCWHLVPGPALAIILKVMSHVKDTGQRSVMSPAYL